MVEGDDRPDGRSGLLEATDGGLETTVSRLERTAGRLERTDGRLDVGGYVARARRRADLNQRELASKLSVSPSTVARWETGAIPMRVDDLATVLDLAGLRVQVVDSQGRAVPPFDPQTVRDNAGRRFPAHLDVAPPDQRPLNRGLGPRFDRRPARGWYALRPLRDPAPAGRPEETAPSRPRDHPTSAELVQRADELRAMARNRVRGWVRPRPQPDCTCPVGCFEVAGCLPTCPCRCEPAVRADAVPGDLPPASQPGREPATS